MDLFDHNIKKNAPLADRMRPKSFDDFVGQKKLVNDKMILRKIVESEKTVSMIFWGPPGSGKTTLAYIISSNTKSVFVPFSAISSGVKELRQVVNRARELTKLHGQKTILFIDEIHRWNKAQQDSLLPSVEDGTIILVGATTENPSFEVNSALLSRCRVFVLEALDVVDIEFLLKKALGDKENGLGGLKIKIDKDILNYIANISNGDARVAYNTLDLSVDYCCKDNLNNSTRSKKNEIKINKKDIEKVLEKTHLIYDRAGEQHYNIISALHKSMRGGDADAALYWLGRMLEAGENPLYIARRLVRFASEDIGMANSEALVQAVSSYQACHYIGVPECNVNLAQAVVYMARSKKSNKLYVGYKKVQKDIKDFPNEGVPLHIRNAPTKLMKNLDYGKGYKYSPDHEYKEKQEYLPKNLKGRKYLD